MKDIVAFFDFDGTITKGDSFLPFIIFSNSLVKVGFGLCILSPILLLYKFKMISNGKAKELVFSFFYKGWEIKEFQKVCKAFADTKVDGLLNKKAFDKLSWHLENGHRVVIISASIEDYIKPWTSELGIDLIGTIIEVQNGKLTGKFNGENCYGIEKVRRIQSTFNLDSISYSYGYGDSPADKHFMNLTNEMHYNVF